MPNYVPGVGSFSAKLMIVGEAPGQKEDEQLTPFVGPAGELLNDALSLAGTSRSEVFITNVVKYRPPLNDFSKLDHIGVSLTDSIRDLWDKEINKIKPNCILCVGEHSLNAVTGFNGIRNYRGSILRSRDGMIKVVPCIHPAALFPHGKDPGLPWVWKKIINHDINRAVEQSRFSEFRLPQRDLRIAHSSLDVFRFFQEYKNVSLAANDIESVNCIPVCTGFAFNKHHALSIPLLRKIGNHHLTDMSQKEVIECWKLVQEQFHRLRLIGQNAKYDEFKQRLFGFSNLNFTSDTLLKFHTLFPEAPEKGLAMISSLFTEEPYYKDDGKELKVGKVFDVKKFFTYNARDCAVEFECDEEMEKSLVEMGEHYKLPLVDFYYKYVMRAHSFFLEMENRGFAVDQAKKIELKNRYEFLQETVHERLVDQIGHDLNVKSYPIMYQLLFNELKFKPPKKDHTSEDTLVSLMANQCKGKDGDLKKQILEGILEERRIRDQLSRAINFTPDYDGRCKTSVKIVGTETGRRSTNILQKPVRPKKIGLSFHTIPKHGRLARDIRSMFIPDKGSVFIQGDLSQAEARIVAVLAQDWELLEAFDKIDIHRRTAGLFFGYTGNKLNLSHSHIPIVDDLEKDGPERFTGKTFRHAGNYDMRKHTAMVSFNTNAQKYEIKTSISEWKAGQFIEMFHDASPRIRKVFHEDIRSALDNGRTLITPYGRPRIFHGKHDSDLYGEGYAQIPQSTVSDTTLSAALAMWDEIGHDNQTGFFVSENHDALVMQVPIKEYVTYAMALKKHMTRQIDFSRNCTLHRKYVLTIPVDLEVSIDKEGNVTNYGQLYKIKV